MTWIPNFQLGCVFLQLMTIPLASGSWRLCFESVVTVVRFLLSTPLPSELVKFKLHFQIESRMKMKDSLDIGVYYP